MEHANQQRNDPATVASVRLCGGIAQHERDEVIDALTQLDRRLRRFRREDVELELSIKERGTNAPYVVLECWIARLPRLVATSRHPDLAAALTEVRDDLHRQIDKSVNKRSTLRRRHLASGADAPP